MTTASGRATTAMLGVLCAALAACDAGSDTTVPFDAGGADGFTLDVTAAPDAPDGTDRGAPDVPRSDAGLDATPAGDAIARGDDAAVVSVTFPDALSCGATTMATVVVRNTGTTTWSRADGYKLGAVGDADPLHPGEPRVWINAGDTVPPGATHEFDVPLTGPATPATYATRWQMVHESVAWFGQTASHNVVTSCAARTDAGSPPADTGSTVADAGPRPTIDLARASVLNSPADVASWPETARINTLDLNLDGVYIDFTKRDGAGSWPDVPFGAPGDSLEYTLWIVLNIDGQWVTSGCIQYWRGLMRNGGPPSGYAMNWYYDASRWGRMTGHQPAVGEWVGFFVTAGDARNVTDHSGSSVFERSNVVVVPFPADPGAVFSF